MTYFHGFPCIFEWLDEEQRWQSRANFNSGKKSRHPEQSLGIDYDYEDVTREIEYMNDGTQV